MNSARHRACLLGDCAMDDILFCKRQVIREEGDKFNCQVSCALEGLSAQGFVKEGDTSALVFFDSLDMDGTYSLALGLCKGGGIGSSCNRKGG